MTDRTDDDFRAKPGRSRRDKPAARSRGLAGRAEVALRGPFSREVARNMAIAKRTSGRGSYRKSASPRTGRFNARGRGRAALARGIGVPQGWVTRGAKRYRGRRAIVKVSVVKLRGRKTSGAGLVRGQLAYLQREEAGVALERDVDGFAREVPCHDQLYGPEDGVAVDARDFVERSASSFDGRGDPHQFRVILSPEDGAPLAAENAKPLDAFGIANGHPIDPPNLRRTTRALMAQMEADLGTRLDWVAVGHFDTAHPHTHVLVRGVAHDGKGLNIAGEYIGRGIRGRLEEQITQELALKSQREVQREAVRDYKAEHVTRFDRAIRDRTHAASDTIDLRAGSAASRFHHASGLNRQNLVGRLKHLETMGLATAQAGQANVWHVAPDALDRLQAMAARKQLIKEMHAAMERAGIKRLISLGDHRRKSDRADPHDDRTQNIVGRVIGKSLACDEGMNAADRTGDKVRLIIDGKDGYVRAVETGLDTRAGEAAKIGSVVEVGPPKLRKIDRSIRDLAAGPDIAGKPRPGQIGTLDINGLVEGSWDERHEARRAKNMSVYRKRLDALTKAGIVSVLHRHQDGNLPVTWAVPDDFERRVIELDLQQGRASGVTVLSVQSLEEQLESPGATWLDRRQRSWMRGEVTGQDPHTGALRNQGFASDLNAAFQTRQCWLIQQDHAHDTTMDDGAPAVQFNRGYTTILEQAGHATAADTLANQTGKQHVAAQQGRMIEGTVTRKLELPHGPHAVVETQRAFYLVPWQSVHEQQWGKRIHGRVRSGGGISWEVGRSRGMDIGM